MLSQIASIQAAVTEAGVGARVTLLAAGTKAPIDPAAVVLPTVGPLLLRAVFPAVPSVEQIGSLKAVVDAFDWSTEAQATRDQAAKSAKLIEGIRNKGRGIPPDQLGPVAFDVLEGLWGRLIQAGVKLPPFADAIEEFAAKKERQARNAR